MADGGAPECRAAEVEKVLLALGLDGRGFLKAATERAAPRETERAVTRRDDWRSCWDAVRRLRLTADMVGVRARFN